jgi:SAM-dependent methyltransferase
MIDQKPELTFKYNQKQGRHGWLRLTPAYSVKVVEKILDSQRDVRRVLDPFSGTGTTGLVCAERGIDCDLLDINPFLVWLARLKTTNFSPEQLDQTQRAAKNIVEAVVEDDRQTEYWTPPISNINRWWTGSRLQVLARLFHELNQQVIEASSVKDLLLIAFCRLVIQWSNAAFNHQSMSFKPSQQLLITMAEDEEILQAYLQNVNEVIKAAHQPLTGGVHVRLGDSRFVQVPDTLSYDCVITSPPYPNRMSYIRELRPYMYWLGYLREAHEAGEMDWQAIGGTWGIATSRLQTWTPDGIEVDNPQLQEIVAIINEDSPVLANYVHKYFVDMSCHFSSLFRALEPGARLFYIVGNSRFYDTLVPVESLLSDLLHDQHYVDVDIETIRKRTSKKELYEYIVSCRKPLS